MRWIHTITQSYDPETVLPLAAVKAELDIDHNDDDSLITSHRDAAIGWVENYTNRFLGPKTVLFTADYIPGSGLQLPFAPFTSLTTLSVGGEDVANPTTIAAAPGLLLPPSASSWPSYTAAMGAVQAEYIAGYAAGSTPEVLLQAAKLMTGLFYDKSDRMEKDTQAVQNLIREYRWGAV